jgi:hypothetical protein
MSLETLFGVLFAAGIVVAAGALALTAFGRPRRLLLRAAIALVGGLAVAAWIAFALRPGAELALSAAGLTACLLAAAAALPLARALARNARVDTLLSGAEEELRGIVARETSASAAELERLLARLRADSLSALAEQERRLAEERRRVLAERDVEATAALSEGLAEAQRRIENRLGGWTDDLERAQQHLTTQLARLAERQRQLIAEAEARIAADVERLDSGTEEQRAAVVRLREQLGQAAEQIVAESSAELESHAADRRRALHELGERLRRRERELNERIEREEAEATQRIHSGFADLERRALEALERSVNLASTRLAEASTQEFATAIKTAREDAARRLSRELDRAVETFSRDASNVLAEKLAAVGDAGSRRVDRRMSQIAAGLERQRDELAASLEQRLDDYEAEFRRRLQSFVADANAERAVLEARLQELDRRVDEAVANARERLAGLETRAR